MVEDEPRGMLEAGWSGVPIERSSLIGRVLEATRSGAALGDARWARTRSWARGAAQRAGFDDGSADELGRLVAAIGAVAAEELDALDTRNPLAVKRALERMVGELEQLFEAMQAPVVLLAIRRTPTHPMRDAVSVNALIGLLSGFGSVATFGAASLGGAVACQFVELHAAAGMQARALREAQIDPTVPSVLQRLEAAWGSPAGLRAVARRQGTRRLAAGTLTRVFARRVSARTMSGLTILLPAAVDAGMTAWNLRRAGRHRPGGAELWRGAAGSDDES